MKKYLLVAAVAASSAASAQYATWNVTMLSRWDSTQIPQESTYHIRYNGIWGWHNPVDNREYAIIGSTEGVHFVEVTNPQVPVQRDFKAGKRNQCIWRELKTYGQYCYAVSDDGSPNSLQIFDMSYLPDSVKKVYDSNSLVERAHTIFIDGNKMYLGSPKGGTTGNHNMAVYSLVNPVAPVLLRTLDQDYPSVGNTHDMFVRNDTVYASQGYNGLYFFRYDGVQNKFFQLASLTSYPDNGYNHSSALTDNGKTLVFCDEVPVNLRAKTLDVSNLGNLTVLDLFQSSTTATPHNPFIRQGASNYVIIAWYQDGVQIFDISNPSAVTQVGYIDTNPNNCPSCPNPSYSGAWGAYVDLPSGLLISSDMQNGLFAFKAFVITGDHDPSHNGSLGIFPNPFNDNFTLYFSAGRDEKITYEVFDVTGRVVMSEEKEVTKGVQNMAVDASMLTPGIYMIRVRTGAGSFEQRLVKQ